MNQWLDNLRLIDFYHDRRDDLQQWGVVLWNDTIFCVAVPTKWELWYQDTINGKRRYAFFSLEVVEWDYRKAIDLTLGMVLFSVAWEA